MDGTTPIDTGIQGLSDYGSEGWGSNSPSSPSHQRASLFDGLGAPEVESGLRRRILERRSERIWEGGTAGFDRQTEERGTREGALGPHLVRASAADRVDPRHRVHHRSASDHQCLVGSVGER